MPHALLLSPDDQAVSAITGVLEEMSVTCERPLDGVSAAQKLNSQSFDLVLVDCENLPAAKLIFDVCRRGKNGNNPVPIAIVDGRAGLPTAFRLGAELILTKPVAKDQARSTIRTAVGRVRKDVPASESLPTHPASAAAPGVVTTEERTQAAAAAASFSPLTNFSDPAPSFVPASVASAAATAMLSAPDLAELETPAVSPQLNPQSVSSLSGSSIPDVSLDSKLHRPLTPSDDPVLAEIERTELEESDAAESKLEKSKLESPAPDNVALDQPAATATSATPVFSSHHKSQKSRNPLVALLILVLAGAGFYAAWMYQPGFRELAQPQIDRVLALAGMAHHSQSVPPSPAPNPVKAPSQLIPATTAAPGSAADPNQASASPSSPPSTPPDSATNSPADSPSLPATAKGQAQPAAPVTSSVAPAIGKPERGKLNDGKPSDSKKDAAAMTMTTTASDAQLPSEGSAIILSSQGAEKRLAHRVPAKYPADARSAGAEGTVVLKAVVDGSGKVAGVRLVEGNADLATAAIEAVKQWRYRPYVRDGKTLPFQTVVIVDFQRP